MTGIFFDEGAALKTYSALTKAGKSVIKIEIEVTDHFELGHILRQLDAIEKNQKDTRKAQTAKSRKAAKAPLALPAPLLGLPYYGESE